MSGLAVLVVIVSLINIYLFFDKKGSRYLRIFNLLSGIFGMLMVIYVSLILN